MTAALYALDPYRKNAYSDHVSFDIEYKTPYASKIQVGIENTERAVEEYNPEVSLQKTPTQTWEMDVRSLVNSKKWISQYGLRRSKLTLYQVLPVIGFKVSDDFDRSLKRPISSRYADGLFHQILRPDGKTFNITCSRDQLRQIEARLNQSLLLFKRRLEWLTTESRRLFGVIEEKALTIVLDIRNMSPVHFDQYRMALERVIYEQLTQVVKFNLIRSTDDIEKYQSECVPVTHDTIQGAVDWVWGLDRLAPVAKTSTCEAIVKASMDPNNEAIYLFTEGTAIETCKEILKEKVRELHHKVPVHTVAFNCDDSATVRFLKDFADRTCAKFHAYSVIMEMDSYESSPIDPRNNRANIVLKKRTYGGVPPGAGMREDVALLFEEIEETRNTIAQVQAIMEEVPEPKVIVESVIDKTDLSERDEQYMGTKQWLNIYGLGARRLELWDVLGSVAFKHRDGIVDLKVKPDNNTQTEALTHSKLINARYCDKFPVVKWKDGQVMHVQVTPEIHRRYERKINISLRSFHQRIDWLKQGSRALFGTVIEDQIYVLIDTSASMLPSITFVKDKLFILMQEQLRHKKKFNMVAFNSKAITWQNRMVDVTEQSLIGAWKWVQNLSCWGSTNTYAALQHALSDPGTQAIYLLTDGRPDQPPKSIIAQVQMQHCVPVHAISFNCNDTEANQFLSDLAQATDGRYHYFSEKGIDADQPKSWESEDIRLLKEEIRRGLEHLQKIEDLRDECSDLSWKSGAENLRESRCSRNHPMPKTDRPSAVPAMNPSEIFRPDPLSIPRPKSCPPPREDRQTPSPPPRSASPPVQKSSLRIRRYSRPVSARKSSQNPLSASKKEISSRPRRKSAHTRTSLLRTMTSTGRFDPDEWLLPETRQLFEKQAKHQQQLAEVDQKRENARTFRKKRLARAKETSSKIWLSKHGLVAKKLTILDALAPTFIPRRAKYVPILDRHVLSKVFDDILPMAHVSSRKPHVTLINPSAVDLHGYEQKVHKAIVSYHKRLNKIVWEALPEEERKKLDSDKPVPFEENRNELLDALDNAGWPIKENDIILLEEEITRANNFLQQSKDLRRASDPRRKDSYDNLLERVMDMDDQDKSSSSSSSDSESDDSRSDHSDKGNKSVRSEKSDKGDRSVRSDKSDKGDRSVRSDRSKDRKEDDDLNVYDDKASVASSLTDKSTHDFFEVSHT
ncbi:Hypothetical predicted protein [Mytilus galloprovincialis]|uniref:VWFA domain-containing protein n=1 Tax=Mytilus galloprovincialis TaxID=29158 RepID=A0A8B6C155_MYTGA|nr:Hypothetical predicted protein [Mytilus galloprovincialis]